MSSSDRHGTPAHSVKPTVAQILAIAVDAGGQLSPTADVLDFGCGRGETVAALRALGYAAQGVDIEPYWASESGVEDTPPVTTYLHLAQTNPYRLPFADASFDLVISEQVLEHVMDYGAAFRELRRVLRPNGRSVHIFPARWRPIENHVKVPLATVIRSRAWLGFWARAGIRNEFQGGLGWREVARLNHAFLHAHTNYLPARAIVRIGREAGVRVQFIPGIYLAHHPGPLGRLARGFFRWLPDWSRRLGARLVSGTTQRCIVVQPLLNGSHEADGY